MAENFRFLESFIYAAKRIGEMGRVLGFNVRMATFVRPGDKYFGMRQYPFPLLTPIITNVLGFETVPKY